MAKIIPFKGIFYNPDKVHNLADVATPPYDVISKQEQHNFYKRHPHNIIRLILNRKTENDTNENNPHARAADFFNNWLSKNILIQDELPALYLTSVEFLSENKTITRFGLIALAGLEPFEKGIILPHEKTFSKIKSERFDLLKDCHANFSPIFSLYSDQKNILCSLKDTALNKTADINFTDDKNLIHKLWRITDTTVHRYISNIMKEKKLFIADGHHRYETALNYRDWVSNNNPDFSTDHPANYVMMYLSSMEDPGLNILPAHRMLTGIQDSVLAAFIQKIRNYFDVTTISFKKKDQEKAQAEFISTLKLNLNNSKNTIGVFMKDCLKFYLLTLKPNVMEEMFGNEFSDSLRNLDVTVLTHLIFIEILGFDLPMLDDEKIIAYSSDAIEAIDRVSLGKCDIAFILNPTKINQVRNIAEEGLIMPRKSTYFYPKVITGQVLNILTVDNPHISFTSSV